MALTFADTHNMIAYLTKSDASEGFDQILDFLNASAIQYALTVNPNIYVSCIKQFWSSVSIKKTNDVVRLQALIDRKKVIITEDTVHQALRLDDAESIDCLPNEEIFIELARIGYEKPSTKLTFYKVGNGFSRIETPLFEEMLVTQQAADDVADVVANDVAADDVPTAVAEPTPSSPTPTTTPTPPQQEVTSTPPLSPHHSPQQQPSSPLQQPQPSHDAAISIDLLNTLLETYTSQTRKVKALEQDKVAQAIEIIKLKQRVRKLEKRNKEGIIANLDADKDVTLEEVDAAKDAEDDEPEPAELKEVIEVVTTTAASTITVAPSAARRRKGVVIRDPEETATPSTIIEQDDTYGRELEAELNKNIKWDDVIEQVKEKGKQDNAVLRYQALKRKPQTEAQARKNMMVYLKNMAGFKMDFFREKSKEQLEEEARKATPLALKVPVIDYQIHTKNNKPYYKIIRADGSHQLFLSFLSLLRNFDREYLEMLWQIVQERFASSKLKNFSDDFLLNTLKAMFEKPEVEALI
nr:hypothetical protein [Tanacetum cinerariifolium]